MGIINREDIRGAEIDGKIICEDCLTDKENDELKEDQILTEDTMDSDKMFFCDRCKKEL